MRLSAFLAWAASTPAFAQKAGDIVKVGDTLVSAMMMFLGNDEKVYIMDKTEGNAQQINGHSAWASVWDIKSQKATLMDFRSNAFCASGMHLPNGSYATFGGNGAIGPGGSLGDKPYPGNYAGEYDSRYQDYDGSKSIRILSPCTGDFSASDVSCQWFDDASVLAMQRKRWYSTAEALADGSIVLIGGFVNGGYINRNYPNKDPDEGGAAENTYEFFPTRGDAVKMQFMRDTSGLNSYAHAFLMPSGKMFVQANYSTILWDYDSNTEYKLPDMPGQIVRVYPASGAVAMLPLTPANNYTPTVLFCGGIYMDDVMWGDYSWPTANTWDIPASNDCQRITPEPAGADAAASATPGAGVAYEQDDDMLEGRTMGQFIALPTGQLLVLNGGANGTAGYATQTGTTASLGDMPFGMSLASGPVGTPALYDPLAPKGQRWSRDGLGTSAIPRLYHSSALLLPDGSVMIAGSNPNVDVNLTTVFPTTYTAEIFYPAYFGKARPAPTGVPTTIAYGGDAFDVTVPASSYSGSANDAAGNATVVLVRPGWTTHAMNMGQRMVQLNNTFSVNNDSSITLHTAQAPPNPNLLTPGPALLFVVVNGVPSVGKMVMVGNGVLGKQPTAPAAVLPPSVRLASAEGSGSGAPSGGAGNSGGSGSSSSGGGSHTGAIVGGAVAGVAALALLAAIAGIVIARRRRRARAAESAAYGAGPGGGAAYDDGRAGTPSTAFGGVPPMKGVYGAVPGSSTASLGGRTVGDESPSTMMAHSPLRA